MSDIFKPSIEFIEDASEIWSTLAKTLETAASRRRVLQEFMGAQMKPMESIADYTGRLFNMQHLLQGTAEQISEEVMKSKILSTLTHDFEPIATSLSTSSKPLDSIDRLAEIQIMNRASRRDHVVEASVPSSNATRPTFLRALRALQPRSRVQLSYD